MLTRRSLIIAGGAVLAALHLPRATLAAEGATIAMHGDTYGSEVWFEPAGLLLRPGATVTWRNEDLANSHTSTAFHPTNRAHPLRIPEGAKPWNSDYLLPGETFSVTLTEPGVYDYFCIPHELAGMVGRIVVMTEDGPEPVAAADDPAIKAVFPPVADIVRLGSVPRLTTATKHGG